MTFADHISRFRPADVASILRCPADTVYSWRTGHRTPPAWQQPLILERLAKLEKRRARLEKAGK